MIKNHQSGNQNPYFAGMRYKLTFEYDGTHFSGWQKQPDTRTVEGVIEEAFSTLYQQEIDLIGQGRTDAGVHARGQVAHADLPDKYPTSRILHAMRGLLPEDAALLDATVVSPDFHARFDASSRKYCYSVISHPSPLHRHVAWFVAKEPDPIILKELAEIISGEHDFVNFCIPSGEPYATTVCNITQSRWVLKGNSLIYEIEGSRFLRHMVRRLVGGMMQAATGATEVKEFSELLTGKEAPKKAHTAPAQGLVLESVKYISS